MASYFPIYVARGQRDVAFHMAERQVQHRPEHQVLGQPDVPAEAARQCDAVPAVPGPGLLPCRRTAGNAGDRSGTGREVAFHVQGEGIPCGSTVKPLPIWVSEKPVSPSLSVLRLIWMELAAMSGTAREPMTPSKEPSAVLWMDGPTTVVRRSSDCAVAGPAATRVSRPATGRRTRRSKAGVRGSAAPYLSRNGCSRKKELYIPCLLRHWLLR